MDLNKIYNEDCLEGMKRIPDKSVDCVICDLPYGITANKWDSVIPLERLWGQYGRIVKDDGAMVLFAQMPFSAALVNSCMNMFKYEIVWVKTTPTNFLNAKYAPLRVHESILVFSKGCASPCKYGRRMRYNPQKWRSTPYRRSDLSSASSNYNKVYQFHNNCPDGSRYPLDVVYFSRDRQRLHPTQKPVALIEYLVRTYTNEGDTVLDNCIGSGTTAIACINTNRNYIGFELDKGYYDIAVRRIEEAKRAHEQDLFNNQTSQAAV